MNHDTIILLGTQPDPETWEFPKQIFSCIESTASLLTKNNVPTIITSGKWSIDIDNKGFKQPFEECDRLAELLIDQGVPSEKILRERDSQDTISNLYFIKKQFLIPMRMRNLLFVVADFRIPRLKFLCERILGPEYKTEFIAIPAKPGPSYNEKLTFKLQSEFLAPMTSGRHDWLDDKFYDGQLYRDIKKK